MDRLSRRVFKCILKRVKSDPAKARICISDIDDIAAEVDSSPDRVHLSLQHLVGRGYLEEVTTTNGTPIGFELSHVGIHKREFDRIRRGRYIIDNWIAILALAVAAIALIHSMCTVPPAG